MSIQNYELKKGNTFYADVYFTSGGKPMPLTGYSIFSQARKQNGDLLANLACNIVDSDAGHIIISALDSVTSQWELQIFKFDVKVVAPNGDVDRTKTISVKVTRAETL